MGIYFGNLMINNGGNVTTTDSLPYLTKATLTTYNWVNNQQTVTIEGIVSDATQQVIEITPVFNESIIKEIASCNIYALSQENNSITFFCDTIPTIDVDFYIKWQDINWIGDSLAGPPTDSSGSSNAIPSLEGVEF